MRHILKTPNAILTLIIKMGVCFGVFALLGCGLPNTSGIVPEASSIRVNGDTVTFQLIESSGFVLYYRFYAANETIRTDLSVATGVGETAIFNSLRHHKAYPSGGYRPRFIWQPSATDTPPYRAELTMNNGHLVLLDNSSRILFEGNLFRTNLLDFDSFRAGDSDMVAGSGLGVQLAWAIMNTRLDPAIFVLDLSHATYLGHTGGITVN